MKIKGYEWKLASMQNVDAGLAGGHIAELSAQKGGDISAAELVEASRKNSALLHGCFEWNDGVAAEAHRKEQARSLMRNLRVTFIERPEATPIRALVTIKSDSGNRYIAIGDAMSNEVTRKEIIGRARAELESWRARYAAYRELGKAVADVGKAIATAREAEELVAAS